MAVYGEPPKQILRTYVSTEATVKWRLLNPSQIRGYLELHIEQHRHALEYC
jgi:hypothetical protein